MGSFCGGIALATIFKSSTKHKSIAAFILAVMIVISSIQAFVIERKATAIKK